MNMLAAFAETDWLSSRRARAYNGALAAAMLAFVAWVGALTLIHLTSKPVALDFTAFWAASRLGVAGQASAAYDHNVIEAIERAATDMAPGYLAFYYPPTFLLLILPLGLLSYNVSLVVFLTTEMALVVAALRRLLPTPWAWLPLLSFPGFLMNGLSGQNGALSAACFAGAAIWLERSPLLAGACLAALTCKPQLAVCIPIALLSARRWRVLVSCVLAAATLTLASSLVFGSTAWRGFLHSTTLARTDIETISIKWPKLQSVFGAVHLFGGGNTAAYASQIIISITGVTLLVCICSRRPGRLLEMAALATTALLFTPFLYEYDLAILAVPLTCMTSLALQTGWRSWERLISVTVFLLPLAALPAGLLLHVTLGPPFMLTLLLLLARRAFNPADHAPERQSRPFRPPCIQQIG